ncbi:MULTISPECIES: hypothetical protein [unclassified Pseudomonas]|jgi:hypothetical protein|uniref:hypothetical protein n=1 Tax=unclassified Pseudomonas TaxID=196821 RepID=UPI001B33C206|nr:MULTISPECIES: hypothetical protein [unclassified Pseudomonas]
MLLADECFKLFIQWLISLPFFSVGALERALEEFGGVDGVIENSYYISAYEYLGCALVQENSFELILEFFRDYESELSQNPECLYYFIESMVDHSVVRGDDPAKLISTAPDSYKAFLRKRFL